MYQDCNLVTAVHPSCTPFFARFSTETTEIRQSQGYARTANSECTRLTIHPHAQPILPFRPLSGRPFLPPPNPNQSTPLARRLPSHYPDMSVVVVCGVALPRSTRSTRPVLTGFHPPLHTHT